MNVLITGISGTLGTAVLNLLESGYAREFYENLRIFGITRDEHKYIQITRDHPKVVMYLNDVCKFKSSKKFDVIFHFAALKHIDLIEKKYQAQSLNTNVMGTKNMLRVPHSRFILSSTDKAAYPINLYGIGKALAEKMVRNESTGIVCRYGNVFGSNGSVCHIFRDKIEKGEHVPITDARMTRFWIKIEDAAKFIVDSATKSPMMFGDLRIPNIKGFPILGLAELIGEVLGKPVKTKIIGARAGEKTHECLRTRYDNDSESDFFSNESMYSEAEMIELIKGIL